jgi:hypothetical protein
MGYLVVAWSDGDVLPSKYRQIPIQFFFSKKISFYVGYSRFIKCLNSLRNLSIKYKLTYHIYLLMVVELDDPSALVFLTVTEPSGLFV